MNKKEYKSLKKLLIVLAFLSTLCFLLIHTVLGATYNLEPGNCMIGSDNNTYCSVWTTKNQTINLEFEEDWHHDGMNITVKCQDFPKINENLNLGIGEKKTYHDYNLSVLCADMNYSTISLLTGQNQTDDKHKVHLECGLNQTAVQDIKEGEKDLYPGDQWYGIRCVPSRDPIKGTILLKENTTFGEWNFTTKEGTALITVNPSDYFTAEMGYAQKYSEAKQDYESCYNKLDDMEKDKNNYKTMIIFIAIIIGIIGFMMFKDNRVGQLLSFFKNPKIKWDKIKKEKLKETRTGNTEVQIPVKSQEEYLEEQRRMQEYKRRFGLK